MDTLPPIDDSILNEHEIKDTEQQPQYVYVQPQSQPQPMWEPPEQFIKKDIFSELDKNAYILIFVAFILGFFMGKTMQPVILRHS